MASSIEFHHETFPIPLYSVLINHKGKRIQEEYVSPYTKNSMHRMFSAVKSFDALAICALASEGYLNLDDIIIQYFPDYLPENLHSFIADMTIQDLLDMRTCHSATTYKKDLSKNWTESFFTTAPDHRSGQVFIYDTSASHTLAALVNRISGKGVLEYLRSIYLNDIGFSKDAYILRNSIGEEIGGDGLIARSEDLMVTAEFLMALYKGTWKDSYSYLLNDQYDEAFYQRYSTLVRQCMSWRSPTLHVGKTLDECQGYGSQFWIIRNGIMIYGLGGQYAVMYPEEDLIIVTTADTQSIQGGSQILLDEMNRIDSQLRAEAGRPPLPVTVPDRPATYGDPACLQTAIHSIAGTYQFPENSLELQSCTIDDEAVTFLYQDRTYRFPILLSQPMETEDPVYHQKLYIRTSGLPDGALYQHVQILGEYVGSIRILMKGDGTHLTLFYRMIEPVSNVTKGFLEGLRVTE